MKWFGNSQAYIKHLSDTQDLLRPTEHEKTGHRLFPRAADAPVQDRRESRKAQSEALLCACPQVRISCREQPLRAGSVARGLPPPPSPWLPKMRVSSKFPSPQPPHPAFQNLTSIQRGCSRNPPSNVFNQGESGHRILSLPAPGGTASGLEGNEGGAGLKEQEREPFLLSFLIIGGAHKTSESCRKTAECSFQGQKFMLATYERETGWSATAGQRGEKHWCRPSGMTEDRAAVTGPSPEAEG